jgi:hypothetical protein
MNDELEAVRGSGNVFGDLGLPDADLEQAKALFAAEIIRVLDEEGLSVRQAGARSGVSAADFMRIREVDLDGFTIDRPMQILGRLDRRVEVHLSVWSERPEAA